MPVEASRRLSDPEIHTLLRLYQQTRRPEYRDQIVMQYTNLVESIARRFAGATEPAEDLVQEGYIGLITAVDGYDATKGVKFSTYATHFIIGQIKHYLRDKGKIIKEPAWLQELNQKVTKAIEQLSQDTGRAPTHGEVAKHLGMKEDTVSELLTTREVFKVASLDGNNDQEEGSGTYDIDRVKSDRKADAELPVEEKLVLGTALEKLKELEQAVIHEFYYTGKNQTEIARQMGISCNYVSHILRNSTKKLKKILATDDLKETQRELALMQRRLEDYAKVIEEQTVVDPLTRLYNRRYFETRLDEELNRASRNKEPVALLLVQVEGWKDAGLSSGTVKADDMFRAVAELIRGNVRRADIVTRFDIETFGLILPRTGQQVSVVVERLTNALQDYLSGSALTGIKSPITLKMGTSWCPEDAGAVTDLVERAVESLSGAEIVFTSVAAA